MLKGSLKYLVIATVNLAVLTALLALWTDKLELAFNDFVRPLEFLKILAFTTLSLIGMRILVFFFREKNIRDTRTKVRSAMLLTILISSYLYVDYSLKLIENVIVNRRYRNGIAQKIRPTNGLAHCLTVENLTIKEYQEIAGIKRFPRLPVQAAKITFSYQDDGFLPDYSFSLTYELPKEVKVNSLNYTNGDFSKHQWFEIIGNKKRVSYEEYEQ